MAGGAARRPLHTTHLSLNRIARFIREVSAKAADWTVLCTCLPDISLVRDDVERGMELRQEHLVEGEQDFDVFVRQHARPVLAYCLRRSTHTDAHEAASEVFSIAWRKFSDVPDGEAGLYWLFGVARRVLSNQQRAQKRRQKLTDRIESFAQTPAPSAETVVVRNARDQQVIDALGHLDARDQEILALIVWDEVPRQEASNLLGISITAVHKRYQRALRRLERTLRGKYSSTTHPIAGKGGAT